MVIRGLAAFLDSNIPEEIIELDTTNQVVTLYPDKVEQLHKPLEMIELQQLYFEDGKVCAELKFKSTDHIHK